LGLNSDLGSVTLTQLLDALGLNADVGDLSLTGLITDLFPGLDVGGVNLGTLLTDLGIGSDTLGSLLSTTDISDIASMINGALSTLIGSTLSDLINPLLAEIPVPPGDPAITIADLVSTANLTTALDSVTLSTLVNDLTLGSGNPPTDDLSLTQLLGYLGLGNTSTGDLGSITALLTDLGIKLPSTTDLTISDLITAVLNKLDVAIPSTGDISLAALLTDLGGATNSILDTNVGSLLNTLDLGTLLNDLGLSSLPLNLSNLGDLSGLNLGDLLGDLGLGDLANVSVEPLGGFDTILADIVPQQILAALGM
jgi:hypothetical protein